MGSGNKEINITMADGPATSSLLFFLATVLIAIVAVPEFLEASGTSVTIDTKSKNVPVISQNFKLDKWINKKSIPLHLKNSFQYLSMAIYFDRSDVALPGFSKYFRALAEKERENADFLMSYLNKRGGYAEFRDIEGPSIIKWANGLDAMFDVLETEKATHQEYVSFHARAAKYEDPHLTHTIEDQFLDKSVDLIKELGDHIANLQMMIKSNYGLGEYLFDKDL